SDLIETPNLQQQGAGVLTVWLAKYVLGVDAGNERALPEQNRGWFALYALLSLGYRLMVIFGLIWFFYRAAQPYRAEVLVAMFGAMIVTAMVLIPAAGGVRYMASPGRTREVRWRRAALWSVVLLV